MMWMGCLVMGGGEMTWEERNLFVTIERREKDGSESQIVQSRAIEEFKGSGLFL